MSAISEQLRHVADALDRPVVCRAVNDVTTVSDVLKTLAASGDQYAELEVSFKLVDGDWQLRYGVWFGRHWIRGHSIGAILDSVTAKPDDHAMVAADVEVLLMTSFPLDKAVAS